MGGTGRLRGKSFGLFGKTRHGPLKRTRHRVVGRRKHRPFRRRKHWPFEKRRYAIHLATYANAYGFLLESQQSIHGMDEYGMESSEIEAKKGATRVRYDPFPYVLEVKTMNLDGVITGNEGGWGGKKLVNDSQKGAGSGSSWA
ncbi:hypothetical protein Tco_1091554 [Tanacetum coccineum]|uniref:Ribosomal protein L15 n=1 Tax=Tanacetum coccineum TaxID=301880 RepID=A0ABQ5I7H8_9ASTR